MWNEPPVPRPPARSAEPSISGKEVLALAVLLAVGWFILQGNIGFSPQDEGHLWYNAQQTGLGSIPIRDFRSYDPGRYYWIAGWFMLLGSSLFALRISLTVVQAIGLLFGLLLVRNLINRKLLLLLFGILLLLWMIPRHKCFEHALVLGMLLLATWLMDKPDRKRHFVSGVLVGAAAMFGKNIGVYFFSGFLFLILFWGWKQGKKGLRRNCSLFFLGLAVGYLPMIGMLLFVPGFFSSFSDSVLRLFGSFAPAEFLPIPWPWRAPIAPLSTVPLLNKIRYLCESWAFMLLFIFYIIGAAWIFLTRRKPFARVESLLAASLFIGAPWLHHVCSRADFWHLAQGIDPLLIGLAAVAFLARIHGKRILARLSMFLLVAPALLPFLFSADIMVALLKLDQAVMKTNRLACFAIDQKCYWLPKAQVGSLHDMIRALSQKVSANENILIAPYAPGLYCLLNKKSPIWDPFPIHLAPPNEQVQDIRNMESKNVRWALIDTRPLDGLRERAFPVTHELIWQYLLEEFDPLDCPGLSKSQILFKKRR